jgi:hypothetical protein
MLKRTARRSLPVAALVAAGLALAACGSNSTTASGTSSATPPSGGSAGAGGGTSATTSTPGGSTAAGGSGTSGDGAGNAGNTGGTGAGGGPAAGSGCRTANLAFSASGGMGEGEVLINLKNVGATSCSMHGFPGVDLKGRDGTVSAARSTMAAPSVTLAPGRTTEFTLHYPPNNTGGSGETFTTAEVTPPNETHSHTMTLGINVPADSDSAPAISVDPVGAGK